ncbi:Uncharacterized protein Adt_20853 [Abeliophyllum distichum]|uniref:Uncharacterized protein n=2 Tax=Forsythieae TaxID=426104 RepID=A0ABD1SXQ9_9LAMI
MLFTYKSDSAIRQLHSSAWHSSSNTSEVFIPHVMRENSKDLAYANLKDQLVVVKKAKGPSFVERTMKELFQRWELQFNTHIQLKKATLALISLLRYRYRRMRLVGSEFSCFGKKVIQEELLSQLG